jgi:AAA15 family ATPase/GTPase
MRVLPVAAIYGGNASGKTNFFRALSFAKKLIVKGTQPDSLIPVDTFRLDSQATEQPARFLFELLIDETIYEFSFSVTRKAVLEEKLVKILSNSEKVLYERKDGAPNFDSSIGDDAFIRFAFQGTRNNQLFLTNSVSQKVENFRPIYDWFKGQLELVAPDSRFEPFERFVDEGHRLYATMNAMLPQLDTGIANLGGEMIPFENIPLPEPLKVKLQEDVKEGVTVRLRAEPGNERYVVTRKNGELAAKKLVTYHPRSNGKKVEFEMRHESDGSQRLIDLLPAFLDVSDTGSKKVYVIDEVDRSLHTLLTRHLLKEYLASCSTNTRSQLLFTTHDVLLMDQRLLRRDEMWVAERNLAGISNLFSLSEYKEVRYDKDIRKSYLQGRLGGVPRILIEGTIDNQGCLDETEGKN